MTKERFEELKYTTMTCDSHDQAIIDECIEEIERLRIENDKLNAAWTAALTRERK